MRGYERVCVCVSKCVSIAEKGNEEDLESCSAVRLVWRIFKREHINDHVFALQAKLWIVVDKRVRFLKVALRVAVIGSLIEGLLMMMMMMRDGERV